MSQLEIWNNPLCTMELRLEVAVAEIEKLRETNKQLAIDAIAWLHADARDIREAARMVIGAAPEYKEE